MGAETRALSWNRSSLKVQKEGCSACGFGIALFSLPSPICHLTRCYLYTRVSAPICYTYDIDSLILTLSICVIPLQIEDFAILEKWLQEPSKTSFLRVNPLATNRSDLISRLEVFLEKVNIVFWWIDGCVPAVFSLLIMTSVFPLECSNMRGRYSARLPYKLTQY